MRRLTNVPRGPGRDMNNDFALISTASCAPVLCYAHGRKPATPARDRTGSVSNTLRRPPRGFWKNTREYIILCVTFEKLITRIHPCCALYYSLCTIYMYICVFVCVSIMCIPSFSPKVQVVMRLRESLSPLRALRTRAMPGKNYTVHS